MSTPILDSRKYQQLLDELRPSAVRNVPDWNPDAADAGSALAAIFAHYLEILLARLNRVPEKQLIAFLDLMGVGLLQPAAARVPLVFSLAPDAGDFGVVDEGTQAATAQTETDPAVVFETERRLIIVAARLAEAVTIDPERDRYSDRSRAVRGEDPISYDPFRGDHAREHSIYLGVELGRPLLVHRVGWLFAALGGAASDPGLAWSEWRDGAWTPLSVQKSTTSATAVTVAFSGVHGPEETVVAGTQGRWIRATGSSGQKLEARSIRIAAQTAATADGAAVLDPNGAAIPVDPTGPFEPFAAGPRDRSLLLRSSAAFGPGGAAPTIIFDITRGLRLPLFFRDYTLTWNLAKPSGGLVSVASRKEAAGAVSLENLIDTTNGLRTSGRMTFRRALPPVVSAPDPALPEGFWARLDFESQLPLVQAPVIDSLRLLHGIQFDAAVLDTTVVDATKPLAPFGPQPTRGSALYLCSAEAFAQPETFVHVLLDLDPGGIGTPGLSTDDPGNGKGTIGYFRVVWEYPTALGWQILGGYRSGWMVDDEPKGGGGLTLESTRDEGAYGSITDSTNGLQQVGEVAFEIPADIVEATVAGRTGFWVRVRLASGDFGGPAQFLAVDPNRLSAGMRQKAQTGNLAAPLLDALSVAYDQTARPYAPKLLVRNGFDSDDLSADNATDSLIGTLFRGPSDQEPTLYLGFDRQPPNITLSVFFAVPPRQLVEPLPPSATAQPRKLADDAKRVPLLAWEYWNGLAWTGLAVEDGTNDLTESGIVQFIAPADFAPLAMFERGQRWWLRIRALTDPRTRLEGVYLNAVEAAQWHTIRDEIIGSSTGDAAQSFQLSQAPVATGQTILVREPERPPAYEQKILTDEEGADAIPPATATDIWIRWHEVPTLLSSGPHSRHYTIDRVSGAVRFGDGVNGLVPPQGTDNLRAAEYRAGGGAAGNRGAGTVTKLKTSIPFVQAVSNPVAADGGSDHEMLQEAQLRGPQTLRHAGRAVSADDFEWIARESVGTRVARARVLTGVDRDLSPKPGWLTVAVVPRSVERKPTASAQLVREVGDVLAGSAAPALVEQAPSRINVVGPGYVPVVLAAEVVPTRLDQADLVRLAALDALDTFLHPLTGGRSGQGWEFGRDVYLSELYATLENVTGVEHVDSVAFVATLATTPLRLARQASSPTPAGTLIQYTPAGGLAVGGSLTGGTPTVVGTLVEPIESGSNEAMTVVFEEGERVTLTPWVDGALVADDSVELEIRGLSANTVLVEPFRSAAAYPRGSVLATSADTGATLTAEVPVDIVAERLTLQGWDASSGLGSRLRVAPSQLVYSGDHTVRIAGV